MNDEITILSSHEVDEAARKRLEAIYPRLRIYHAPTLEDMEPWIEEADIIVGWRFNDELLKRAHKLRWFQFVGAGVDSLLTPDFVESDVVLTSTRGEPAIQVSEHAFALLLALTRRIVYCYGEENILDTWEKVECEQLCGKTMGVLGMGYIGREIARKAKAFGMKVRGLDVAPVFVPYVDELYLSDRAEDFFSGLDVLVISAALVEKTRGMVNGRLISMMNEGSYVINVARGPIVVEEDLVEALKHGPLAGAGLDVFVKEPLAMDSELRRLPNVALTPHVAGSSPSRKERFFVFFIENFRRWIQGEPLINVVDKSRGF